MMKNSVYVLCIQGIYLLNKKEIDHLNQQKPSKLARWRAKYGALAVTLGCLYTVISNWGDNWFMTILLSVGVFICGTIAFFDMKQAKQQQQ